MEFPWEEGKSISESGINLIVWRVSELLGLASESSEFDFYCTENTILFHCGIEFYTAYLISSKGGAQGGCKGGEAFSYLKT